MAYNDDNYEISYSFMQSISRCNHTLAETPVNIPYDGNPYSSPLPRETCGRFGGNPHMW